MSGQRVRKTIKALRTSFLAAFLGTATLITSDLSVRADESLDALRRGEAALRGLDYNLAQTELDAALKRGTLEPHQRAVALLNRGLARQNLRDPSGAIKDYSEAIQIGTLPVAARAIAHFNRGLAHNAVGQTTLALDDLSNAVKINKAFSQAYNSRATLMRMLGRNASAIKDYQLAIKYRYPQPHLAHYGAALAHLSLRQEKEAQRELNLALTSKPDFQLAREKLAEIGITPEIDNTSVIQTAAADPAITNNINSTTSADDTDTELAGASAGIPAGSFLVQLMAQNSESALNERWRGISNRHRSVIGNMAPIIQRADLGSRVVYRLRIGPYTDRNEADRVCRQLKRRGQDCYTTTAK